MRNGLHALPERKFYSLGSVMLIFGSAWDKNAPLLNTSVDRSPGSSERAGVARSWVEAPRLRSTLSLADEARAPALHIVCFFNSGDFGNSRRPYRSSINKTGISST